MPSTRDIAAAAGKTTSLLVAGVAGLAAAATQSLPILAVGVVTYAALVAADLFAGRPERAASHLPDPRALHDPIAKRACEALLRSRDELRAALGGSPAAVQRYGALALASLPELEQHAATLIARAEELGTYLDRVDTLSVRRDVEQLRRQASSAADPQARAQFEEAAAAREQEVRTLHELADARERLEGHLSRLAATCQSLPSRIVHLRTLDAQAADTMSGSVNEELDRMSSEIGAFEDSLKALSTKVAA